MSSSSPPPDNSLAIEQMQEAAAQRQQAQDKADADKAKADLAALRTTSGANATNSTNSYFQQLGLDPTQYSGDIQTQINDIMNGIAPTDPNPGSSFANAGQNIYNNLTKNYQTKEGSSVDQLFSPDFQTKQLPISLDQPYVSSIVGDQRAQADNIIQNMLKRGVLTSTGVAGAEADLDRQAPAIKGQVQQLADSVLAGGQQSLADIANNARQSAGTLKLGQSFDPSFYGGQANDAFTQFINGLSDSIKAKVPGNLFQTNGLAAIGGAAQGAGNTAYNPNAAAGIGVPPAGTPDPNTGTSTGANSTKESIF